MSTNSESFIRWQSITRDQLSGTTNLVMGLATGVLAFQADILLDNKLSASGANTFGVIALFLLGFSITFALWCAINRLSDFRSTAQIALHRDNEGTDISKLRSDTNALGNTTWLLFRLQLFLFGLGSAFSALAVLLQVI